MAKKKTMNLRVLYCKGTCIDDLLHDDAFTGNPYSVCERYEFQQYDEKDDKWYMICSVPFVRCENKEMNSETDFIHFSFVKDLVNTICQFEDSHNVSIHYTSNEKGW